MTLLTPEFFDKVKCIDKIADKFRWYMVVIVTLSAMNYPDEIPGVWAHFSSHYLPLIPNGDHLLAARKIREALTKSVGIVGAAKVCPNFIDDGFLFDKPKTGTSIRLLSTVTPPELKDKEAFRDKDDPATATARGKALHKRIYGSNPTFNPQATIDACPDYAFVIRDIFYGRIFSFPDILSDIETGHVIISALIGNDCHPQMKHHMIGMLINGVNREEIEVTRTLCYDAAERLGVVFRHPQGEIPELPSGQK